MRRKPRRGEALENGPRRKVGLVWAGRGRHPNDRNRSIRLQQLAGLAQMAACDFSACKNGMATNRQPGAPMELTDWTAELNDFSDTAALIANLDLIISVDTAVVHLAGAMGKPAWVLLPFVPDWRWMLDRNDSPWYPSLRLFRQPAIGEWEKPISEICAAPRG